MKNECAGSQISWRDYIQKLLLETGIPKELFGSWIPSNISSSRVSHTVPQPCLTREESDDEELDFSQIPPKFLKLFMKFKSSTPNSSAKKVSPNKSNNSNPNSSNKKPKKPGNNSKDSQTPNLKPNSNFKPNRNQYRGRGRGRGRGNGAGNNSNNNSNSRGRGN